jgi:hypothetical protein
MTDVVPARNDRLAAREVAGEMVLLSADDSALLVLNDTATAVWRAVDGRTTLSSIARTLCRDYAVDFETALHDVHDLVSRLAAAGVLALREPEEGDSE